MRKDQDNGQTIPEWDYSVMTEPYYHIDLGQFYSFGIRLVGLGYDEIIHDVSVCRKKVAHMVKLFNYHQLSPCHFREAVEDQLADM